MGDVVDRVAIVTGASRGLGAAIAARLAAGGARVAVSARTQEAGQSRFEGTIHETHAVQTWERHGKAWWMVDESRLRGAPMPGLAEPPEPPEPPATPVSVMKD